VKPSQRAISRRPHPAFAFGLVAAILCLGYLGARSASAQIVEKRRDTRVVSPRPAPSALKAALAPVVDGNLDDLIDYVHTLQMDGVGCALEITDPDSDVVLTQAFVPCTPLTPVPGGNYYPNGFDQTLALVAFDGHDLSLGIRTAGMIGDPDGNGDPDTDCGTNILDSPGIGLQASYKWFLDTNCDGPTDVLIYVNNNQVTVSGASYDSTQFAFNGHDLEVKVYGMQIIPQFRARSFAGSDVDGLSEDLSAEYECSSLTPTLTVQKSVGDVCAGGVTTVGLSVTNTSAVDLDPVDLEDGLPEGFTYVASSVSGLGEPTQSDTTLTFPSFSLAPDEVKMVTFQIRSPADCSGQHVNRARATGAFIHPCNSEPNHARFAFDEGSATFECFRNDVTVDNVATCAGSSTQMCAQSQGTSPFTYTWSGPDGFNSTESCITVEVAGAYSVTVTDANGCVGTGGGTLTLYENPTVSVANVCQGNDLCATPSGGTGPYTYAWSTGGSAQCLTAPAAGSYTVTVTDAHGCTGTTGGTVWENPTVSVENVCQGGDLCATPSGGTGPYTYAWSDDSQEQCVGPRAPAGTYTVTVTDTHGCTGTTTGTVYENPTVSVTDVCQGNDLCATPSGGTGPYTYVWSNESQSQCLQAPGTGTYTVTVTDANGCTGTTSGTVYTNPTVSITNVCQGSDLCATPAGGTGPYTYAWNTGGSAQCLTAPGSGAYTVTVTDAHGCTGTTSGMVNPNLDVSVANVCQGGDLCATPSGGTGPYTYAWSTGGSAQCLTAPAAGSYTVTVTDALGCTGTTGGTVYQNPTVDPSDACAGQDVCANAAGGTAPYSYAWSNGGSTECVAPETPGTYTVTVTDANQCTAVGTATVRPNPTVTVQDAEACQGETAVLCPVVEGEEGPFTFSWTGPNGFASGDSCIQVETAGVYSVTAVGVHGCQGFGSGTVTIHANPVVTVTDGRTCEGYDGMLCADVAGGTAPLAFTWSGPGDFSSADSCISVGTAGIYSVTVTDAHGCTGTGSGAMTVSPSLVVRVADGAACAGSSDELCAQVDGSTGPYSFVWAGPGQFASTDSCVSADAEGAYSVTVTDVYGCTGTTSGTMTLHPKPVVEVADQQTCDGTPAGLCAEVSAGTAPFVYQWAGPGDFASTDSCVTVGVDGDYAVTVTDAHGCSGTGSGHLTVLPNLTVSVDDAGFCSGGEAEVCAQVDGDSGPYAFSWTGPDGFSAADSCISVPDPGSYSVTVTDRNGCTGTSAGTVTVFSPSLAISARGDTVCVGETAVVTVSVRNTSPGKETFLLHYTVDGGPVTEVPVGDVASGDSTQVPIEVQCDHPDTAVVSCTVSATLAGSPDCMAETGAGAQVVCLAPAVQITKTDDIPEKQCAEDETVVTYTLKVKNTGPVDLMNLVVTDEVAGPIASFVDAGNPGPGTAPAGGTSGALRWEYPGPLEPGQTLTYTYRVMLSVDGDCRGNPTYNTVARAEGTCGQGLAVDTDGEETCIVCPATCWMTAGGFLNEEMKSGHKEDTFGGNVGPPPSGSWQHVQRVDNKIVFNFHSHDANVIRCYHDGEDGPCNPKTDDNVIEFGGTGEYSMGNGPRKYQAVWTARCEDHGEPGNNPRRLNGGCGSPDYYTIEVRDQGTNEVVFSAQGFLDGGNVQMHKSTGSGTGPAVVNTTFEIRDVMLQAFPNPVQGPSSAIRYAVPNHLDNAEVELNVFDVSGRLVRNLVDDKRPTGLYEISWDLRDESGAGVAAGVYFYRLKVGSEQKITRLLVMRN